MTDGKLIQDGDGYLLRYERELSHSIDRVWRAITMPEDLAAWFPATVELELRVGGKVIFGNDPHFEVDEDLLATSGEIVELDPQRRLAFTWGTDLLRFELSPHGDGCRLVFTHRLGHRAMVNRTASGWAVCLNAFAGSLGEPTDDRGWREYYDHYSARYGDAGVVSHEDGNTVVRFERLVAAPAARVWSTIAAGPQLDGQPGTTGEVRRSSSPVILSYDWQDTEGAVGELKWQLIPIGDTCLVLLTQTVEGDWDATGAMAAWDRVLASDTVLANDTGLANDTVVG